MHDNMTGDIQHYMQTFKVSLSHEMLQWQCTKDDVKWPKWLKTRPKLRLCTKPGTENLILYNI